MLTIEDLLQFHFSPTNLRQSAQRIIPITLSSLNDHRIDKLQKVTDEVGVNSFVLKGDNLIPQVFRKFKKSITNTNASFERRELRTLTFSLTYAEQSVKTIFSNQNELKYALELLEMNWKDSFFVGLIDCFLRHWETDDQKSLDQLEQFILKRLDNYTGNRSTLLSFKKNKRFFNKKNGSETLGYELALRNVNLSSLPGYLGVPEMWISYEYFSKSIIAYYQRNEGKIIEIFDDLIDVLKLHQAGSQSGSNDVKKTAKRLISKIVIQANQPQFSVLQDKVKSIAFKQIGDPSNTANWTAFKNASEIEKEEIIQAKNILNEWITQQFINVFFNVCINDERRKKFWLQFVSKISTFKVYGPQHTKQVLKRVERIAEYVDARFEAVSSKRDVSAFILYIGDYILIEFSNEGYAFYAYKINSSYRPSLTRQLNSVDDLRNGSMPMAIESDNYYDYYQDEGRLTHRDGNQIWETRFNSWMDKKVFR